MWYRVRHGAHGSLDKVYAISYTSPSSRPILHFVTMIGRSFLLLLIAVFMTTTLLLAPLVRAATQDDEVDEYLDIEEDEPAPEVVDDGKVLTLTSENFETVIKKNKNVLVRAFAACADRSTRLLVCPCHFHQAQAFRNVGNNGRTLLRH